MGSERKVIQMQLDLMGLWLVMDEAEQNDIMISRDYIKEKLKRIAHGTMNFHPTIEEKLTVDNYKRWL